MDTSEIEKVFTELKQQAAGLYADRAGTPLGGVFIDVYALTQACLLNDASVKRVIYLVGEVEGIVDYYTGMFPETIQLGERTKATLACKKGCSHCCSMRVTTNPPEALAISEHLRSRDGGAADVVERLREYEAKTELSPDERLFQIMDCPFLSHDLCTIYSHRPKTCRSYHSFDVLRCIADKNNPRAMVGVPQDPIRRDLGDAVFDAMGEACETLGLEFSLLELVPALLVALETPDATRRWLSGERVFSGAHNPELIASSLAATERMNARE